jgi:hypothetical protein
MIWQERHRDVGAYALGVLERADAFRFEDHLTDCATCTVQLSEFIVLEALLSAWAGPLPSRFSAAERPNPALLDRLVAEVADQGKRSRRRWLCLVAANAALIAAAPVAAVDLMDSRGKGAGLSASATDARTGVAAVVSMDDRGWGTDVGLRLSRVWGPQDCELVAVSGNGEEQTVTSWTVPKGGYGMSNSPIAKKWLVTRGAAAMSGADIDHFEVRTADGKHLVTIDAGHWTR